MKCSCRGEEKVQALKMEMKSAQQISWAGQTGLAGFHTDV